MRPLAGIKLLAMKGIGPAGPYAGMLLGEMRAEVIVVKRSASRSCITVPSKTNSGWLRGRQ